MVTFVGWIVISNVLLLVVSDAFASAIIGPITNSVIFSVPCFRSCVAVSPKQYLLLKDPISSRYVFAGRWWHSSIMSTPKAS